MRPGEQYAYVQGTRSAELVLTRATLVLHLGLEATQLAKLLGASELSCGRLAVRRSFC